METKKKKYIFSGILVLLVIIIIIIFVVINNKDKNNNNNDECIDMELSNESVDNIQSNNYEGTSQVITIESTRESPIEKDNIEVTNIEIIDNFGDLQVTTTLKNNSNECLNGFFIEIDLLDKDGKVVTNICQDSEQRVESNTEVTFNTTIVQLDNAVDIVNARVKNVERSSIKNFIDESLKEIEEEGNKMMKEK